MQREVFVPGRWPPRHPPEVTVPPGRPKGNGASFLESFQQPSSAAGGAQTAPAPGKVTRDRDEQREGTWRAAPAPSPVPAARGQRISRDEAQGPRQSCHRDGSAFPVTPTQQGDIWGRVCSHCNPLPVLDMAPHWSELAVRAGITISSWQCLGNVWIDTHRAGQGGCSKGHFVVQGWGCRPAGHGAAKDTGTVTAREGTPRWHRPFLQGTDLPSPSAGHRALPGRGDPCRFSCSSQPPPEELSPQLGSGQGQGTTEGLGSSIPRPGKSP